MGMALSLLQGYSSPSEASESDSDDSDDGIVVTIDRNVLNGGRPAKRLNVKPVTARHPVKSARGEEREKRRVEMEKKTQEEEMVKQRVSTLDMPHYDLGQTTESSNG